MNSETIQVETLSVQGKIRRPPTQLIESGDPLRESAVRVLSRESERLEWRLLGKPDERTDE